ncbi:hypothetical protein [Bradyrhizobium stylosanthis]|uniref:Uncharacterized protein n=1 Tax=Bradyrhizobium stylosanthis TaxID=1803665 RepID=A0A560DFX2_9BRAD|nr:hypothetical protein [Bradyrhizobium stylosanthis]TWA95991.1 hypothetical protein FBZ96_107181 [Bradyrhizobium stylosanthis]
MRYVVRWAACLAMALFSAGCDLSSTQGVGTRLYPADVAAQTDLQNAYVGEICQQAGIQPTAFDGVTSCGPNPYDAATWWLFVQAGMNDIDQRCDAYLAWLDDAQRSREPVLNELALASATAQTIMRSTGVGANPITIAGAAFGLAAGTFTNVQSRLILTMPHSTIQAVVLSRQKEYRDRLIGTATTKPVAIVSRPAALYALRSYLRLCMPMTIETEINNTIATFERNGADGLEKGSLISPRSAGVPFTPASLVQKPPRAPVTPVPEEFSQFFDEKVLSKEDAQFALNALCFDKNTVTSALPRKTLALMLVDIYEATRSTPKPTADHVISKTERLSIITQPDCGDALNFFEKFTFANTTLQDADGNTLNAANLAAFIDLLNLSGPSAAIPNTTKLGSQTLRDKIRAVRTEQGQLDLVPNAPTQATPALIASLRKLKPKPAAPAAPTNGAANPAPGATPNAAPAATQKQ